MNPFAKFLIITGVILICAGIMWNFGWLQAMRLGRLPGDIIIERENAKIYIPVTTGILLSVILSLLSYLFRR